MLRNSRSGMLRSAAAGDRTPSAAAVISRSSLRTRSTGTHLIHTFAMSIRFRLHASCPASRSVVGKSNLKIRPTDHDQNPGGSPAELLLRRFLGFATTGGDFLSAFAAGGAASTLSGMTGGMRSFGGDSSRSSGTGLLGCRAGNVGGRARADDGVVTIM
jgi:hypothetical protein